MKIKWLPRHTFCEDGMDSFGNLNRTVKHLLTYPKVGSPLSRILWQTGDVVDKPVSITLPRDSFLNTNWCWNLQVTDDLYIHSWWTSLCVCVGGGVQLFMTLWTVAHQAALSMGFSRQECWSGLPCPPPGDLPHPGLEAGPPALQVESLLTEPPGKPGRRHQPLPISPSFSSLASGRLHISSFCIWELRDHKTSSWPVGWLR